MPIATIAAGEELTSIITSMNGFSASAIAQFIAAALAVAVPLIVLWVGFRFAWRKIKGAFKGRG